MKPFLHDKTVAKLYAENLVQLMLVFLKEEKGHYALESIVVIFLFFLVFTKLIMLFTKTIASFISIVVIFVCLFLFFFKLFPFNCGIHSVF